MEWRELEKVVAERSKIDEGYRKDTEYFDALSRLRWEFPDDTISDNIDVFINYLSACKSYGHVIDRKRLAAAWLESVELVSADLEDVSLEHLDVLVGVDREEEGMFCVGDVISRVYEEIKSVPGVGPANATRLLHLRFPNLFVMTSDLVRKCWQEGYLPEVFNVPRERLFEPYGYAFIFLPAMHIHLVDAILSCSLDEEMDIDAAVNKLKGVGDKERSLAKLLDEYYSALAARS
ncbi:MAG: hypothetical protein NTU41_03375 [Chloroflexi bacterium]|nr:hypothetical protein [Chloroflexota bacterium]